LPQALSYWNLLLREYLRLLTKQVLLNAVINSNIALKFNEHQKEL